MKGNRDLLEVHVSKRVEYVCIKEDQTSSYDTPSELTNEAKDTSVLHGYTFDELVQ
jgi:hypothetical protein